MGQGRRHRRAGCPCGADEVPLVKQGRGVHGGMRGNFRPLETGHLLRRPESRFGRTADGTFLRRGHVLVLFYTRS